MRRLVAFYTLVPIITKLPLAFYLVLNFSVMYQVKIRTRYDVTDNNTAINHECQGCNYQSEYESGKLNKIKVL